MTHPRIGIVGAGPAGLVVARILQMNGIPFTLFERDSSAVSRAQGGVLDMHPEGGAVRLPGVRVVRRVPTDRTVRRAGDDPLRQEWPAAIFSTE